MNNFKTILNEIKINLQKEYKEVDFNNDKISKAFDKIEEKYKNVEITMFNIIEIINSISTDINDAIDNFKNNVLKQDTDTDTNINNTHVNGTKSETKDKTKHYMTVGEVRTDNNVVLYVPVVKDMKIILYNDFLSITAPNIIAKKVSIDSLKFVSINKNELVHVITFEKEKKVKEPIHLV